MNFYTLLATPSNAGDSSMALAIALGVIMLGLGLSLTIDDFKRVVKYPRAIIVGLVCQMLILPAVCLGIAVAFNLPPVLAVGLMLLAASPGGATANLYSHLSQGDVALNVTLTAVNSVLSVFMLPIIVNFSLGYFMSDDATQVGIQFKKVIEVFAIVLVPVAIGMFIQNKNKAFADKMEKPVKIISAVLLITIITIMIIKGKDTLAQSFADVGLAALAFNVVSIAIGFFIPRLLKIPQKQSIAISMEIAIHNGTLAIFIAANVLNNDAMTIPPAIYSIIMFFTAGIFGYIISRTVKAA
jgi:bile acid:Na+ symporter, BASS family